MYPSLSTPTSDSEWCPIFISDLRWTSSDLSVIASQMELIPQYKSDSDAALEASDGPDLRAASARLIIFKSVCRKSAVRRQAREMCRIRSRPSVSTCYMQETEVHSWSMKDVMFWLLRHWRTRHWMLHSFTWWLDTVFERQMSENDVLIRLPVTRPINWMLYSVLCCNVSREHEICFLLIV